MEYFVVCEDYGRRGREAIVDPELTRRAVVERIRTGNYKTIAFIHRIRDCTVEDVTNDLLSEAGFYETEPPEIDRVAAKRDHAADLRKNGDYAPAYP